MTLTAAFSARVHALHIQAERSGIVNDVLRGRVGLPGYAVLLRNLLPAYQAMENALSQQADSPLLRGLVPPALFRAAAIEADLEAMSAAWKNAMPLLPQAETYARAVQQAATGTAERLIAHAYVRYVGDLSGGMVLQRLLAAELHFHRFPGIANTDTAKAALRAAINLASAKLLNRQAVIEEAALAFQCNIDISTAVQNALAAAPAG